MNHQKNSLAMIFSFRIIIVLLSIVPFSKYLATANNNGLELNSQLKFWEYVKEYSNRGNQNLYPRYGSIKQGRIYYIISNRSLIKLIIFRKTKKKWYDNLYFQILLSQSMETGDSGIIGPNVS